MIEVFKTNVGDCEEAEVLIKRIEENFTGYKANFDLEDCDRILRVASPYGQVRASSLVDLLNSYGFWAEVLPDEQPVSEILDLINK